MCDEIFDLEMLTTLYTAHTQSAPSGIPAVFKFPQKIKGIFDFQLFFNFRKYSLTI